MLGQAGPELLLHRCEGLFNGESAFGIGPEHLQYLFSGRGPLHRFVYSIPTLAEVQPEGWETDPDQLDPGAAGERMTKETRFALESASPTHQALWISDIAIRMLNGASSSYEHALDPESDREADEEEIARWENMRSRARAGNPPRLSVEFLVSQSADMAHVRCMQRQSDFNGEAPGGGMYTMAALRNEHRWQLDRLQEYVDGRRA